MPDTPRIIKPVQTSPYKPARAIKPVPPHHTGEAVTLKITD
ncbi:hypothetical protein N9X05_05010 [Paracoccaceae bacterium]|nr:hypothetical protein [Paracoccaceae bacterium]